MKTKLLSTLSVLTVGGLLAINSAAAQHGESPPVILDTVTVTAEKISEYVKNHSQLVNVLEQKEIRERNILNMEDALGIIPGVDIRRSSGIGVRISIQGSGKSRGVLVLLNGRPLNTGQYDSVDLSTIPIDTVKSVTVFRPPVPVWLGSGASEGAISIVTHDFAASQEKKAFSDTRLKFAAGSYGAAEGSVSRHLTLKDGNVMLTAAGNHRDGKRVNSDKDSGTFSLHWDRKTSDEMRLEADGRFYTAEYGSPGPTDNPTPDARQSYQKGSLDARMHGFIRESVDYTVNAYGDMILLKDESQSGMRVTQDYLKLGIKPEARWSDDTETWGFRINGISEYETVDQTLSGNHDRLHLGLSAQYDRIWKPFTVSLGLRCDYFDDFGFNPGASAGLSYGLSEKLLAKLNAGYSVNMPTFGQMYQPSHGSIDQVRGNPDLDEEKVRSYSLGLEYRFDKNQIFQISLFRSDTSDLISYRRGDDQIYRPVNVDNAYRQGIELMLKYAWQTGIGIDFSYILQDSENRQTGGELPYTPRSRIKTAVKYTIPKWRTRLESTLRYEAGQFSDSENCPEEKLKDYITMDIRMTQPFSMMKIASEYFVQIDNLWNTRFERHYGYPDDGFRFLCGLNLMF